MQICVRVAAVQRAELTFATKTGHMKKTEIGSVRRVSPEYWFKLSQKYWMRNSFCDRNEKLKNDSFEWTEIMYLKIYFDLVQRPAAHPRATFAIHIARASRALKQLSFSRDYAF